MKGVKKMKKYEIQWKPNVGNFTIQTEIVQANSLTEATRIIEAKAKALGATSIWWGTKREIR